MFWCDERVTADARYAKKLFPFSIIAVAAAMASLFLKSECKGMATF